MTMATKAIAKVEPLVSVTMAGGRVMIPSLPEWATSRFAALERTYTDPATGKFRVVWRLPERLIPNQAMRVALQLARGNLERALACAPKNSRADDAAALLIITKMLKTLSGHRLDEAGAEASGEAYMTAIEDLPIWALDEAMRCWYRGDCAGEHDYHWRPDPAELRAITLQACRPVMERLQNVIGVLEAKPEREYTPEQRESNLKRLPAILRGIFTAHVDPIDRIRGERASAAQAQLESDRRRALDDLAAHERSEAAAAQSLMSAGY
jgi:hypothetical protein